MKWEIAENCRADIVGYSGINYSGDRYETRIFPSGRQGDDLPGENIRSMTILAPYGTRVTLRTTLQDNYLEHTWRTIIITKGHVFDVEDGRFGVRMPDLDFMAPGDAFRHNSESEESVLRAKDPDDRVSWTYGQTGPIELKRGIVMITVDKVETDVDKAQTD